LVQERNHDDSEEQKRRHLRMEKIDVIIAMNVAFLVNAAMVIVSAAVFFRNGLAVETIEQAHRSLSPLLGAASAGAFGLALVASGLSSSAVGTMAGQAIMQGFVELGLSDNLTRLITMAPGMAIILCGMNPMQALLLSQVLLSFVLPVAIVPMLLLCRRKDLMGGLVNKRATDALGWIVTGCIIALNAVLLFFVFAGKV
jgi:manganese transport protein